jgi:hypothetical protein
MGVEFSYTATYTHLEICFFHVYLTSPFLMPKVNEMAALSEDQYYVLGKNGWIGGMGLSE